MSSVNIRNKILRENYLNSLDVVTEIWSAMKKRQFQRGDGNSVKYVGNDGREKVMSLEKVKEHMENVDNIGALCFGDYAKALNFLKQVANG